MLVITYIIIYLELLTATSSSDFQFYFNINSEILFFFFFFFSKGLVLLHPDLVMLLLRVQSSYLHLRYG